MSGVLTGLLTVGVALAGQASSQPAPVRPGPARPLDTLIDVELRAEQSHLAVGMPVILEFIVRNKTAESVQLDVPMGDLAERLPRGFELTCMGLPLEHVFSGKDFRALSVAVEGDPYLGDRVSMFPSRTIPPIVLAPLAQLGLKYDILRNYPFLGQQGRYELRWRPYGGQVESAPLLLDVRVHKQVVMDTDAGRLTFRLLYDKAPQTVDNFLDLVGQRFYDRLTFFMVDPALAIQAGDPRGDGTGRRADGRTIPAEFNDTPFTLGTVGMSLSRTSGDQLDPNSASCQFFICLSRQPVLDGRYTAFAQIEGPDSMDTLRAVAAAPRRPDGLPLRPVTIRSIAAVDAPLPPR